MKGSTTIEMAYIMPVIFLVFTVVIYSTFYLYDKNILYGIACEGAVIGSNQYGTAEGVDIEEIEAFLVDNCAQKLLFFSEPCVEISVEDEIIGIELYVEKGQMAIRVNRSMPLMDQEAYIRKVERLKGE